jgi:hypothetical protein
MKILISTEDVYETVIVDAVNETPIPPYANTRIICWNSGEEKNCQSSYPSKGCKAS